MYAIVAYRIPIHWKALLWIPSWSEIKWNTFISTVVWSFGGYDSVGSVAGNVAGGRRTFLIGVMGSFPLNVINYFIPIMLDFIIDPDVKNWAVGYFTHITYHRFPSPPWLAIWLTLSSEICVFAQCSSCLAPVSWTVWAMAKGEGDSQYLPSIFGWEFKSRTGSVLPVAAILSTGISILLISAIPYQIIIQVYLLLRIVNLLFEFASLIWLKIKEPDTPRPYSVPGGLFGSIVITIPTVIIAGLSIVVAADEALEIGGGCLGMIIIVALIRLAMKKMNIHFYIPWPCFSKDSINK